MGWACSIQGQMRNVDTVLAGKLKWKEATWDTQGKMGNNANTDLKETEYEGVE